MVERSTDYSLMLIQNQNLNVTGTRHLMINHQFNELLDMIDCLVTTYDYEVPFKQQKPVKPTQSVVEVHQPHDLAAPDPEEVTNTQHISGAVVSIQSK